MCFRVHETNEFIFIHCGRIFTLFVVISCSLLVPMTPSSGAAFGTGAFAFATFLALIGEFMFWTKIVIASMPLIGNDCRRFPIQVGSSGRWTHRHKSLCAEIDTEMDGERNGNTRLLSDLSSGRSTENVQRLSDLLRGLWVNQANFRRCRLPSFPL